MRPIRPFAALRTGFGGVVLCVAVLVGLTGCQEPRVSPHPQIRAGSYSAALQVVESNVVNKMDDRRYMLDRMRAGVLSLDAGEPVRAERWFSEVYDVLRTQGINEDKTVRSVVFTEGVKVWKGEPFEQALALVYYGYVQASLGSWDNARAAAGNALFYLRDFEKDEPGRDSEGQPAQQRIDTEEIARRAAAYEAKQRGETPGEGDGAYESGDDYLDHGYVAERNNFTMAYLLHGIASQQLGRDNEASDYYSRVTQLDPSLRPLVRKLRSRDYNTVVVLAEGLGPRKVRAGPNGVVSKFQPLDDASSAPRVMINGQPRAQPLLAVTNVNQMALDHRWNNMEDIRRAKNFLGDLLIGGGAAAVAVGANQDSDAAVIAGGAAILAGIYLKATSRANIDYCDVFPQRLFVAALNITQPGTTVTFEVPGTPQPQQATLRNLGPPVGPEAAFHYLRAPTDRDLKAPAASPIPPPTITTTQGSSP